MPNVFFKIGSTDITSWIDIQNYDMNRADVYTTWTDGNFVDHRVITRTRYSGKFDAGFHRPADFAAFAALLESEKTAEGYYPVTAYINNTGTTESFSAFLDVSDADKWDLTNGRSWQVQTVTVTGR